MPQFVLKCLYHSQVLSHLTYCLSIWGLTYPTILQPLFVLQKRALRIITNSKFDEHTNPLFKSLGYLKFFDLVKLEIGCFMFKNKNKDSFVRLVHNYNTRNRNNLLIPNHDLTLFKNCINYQGPQLWNSLSDNLTQARSLLSFKKRYKSQLTALY